MTRYQGRCHVHAGAASRSCMGRRCGRRVHYEPGTGQLLAIRCAFCKKVFCETCAKRHFA